MAIPFLNNITLNNNEIQNVRLQNGGSPPLNSGPGQIYFDSTAGDETAKYYSNANPDLWVSLKEYSFPAVIPANGYVTSTITGTVPKPIINFDLNAVDGPAAETVVGNGIRYLSKNNKWAEISDIPGTYAWTISDNVTPTAGTAGVVSGDTLQIAASSDLTSTLTGQATTTKVLTVGLKVGPGLVGTNDNYISNQGIALADADDSIPFNSYTPGGNPPSTQVNVVKKTTFGTIPVTALTLVKNYIDESVTGLLQFIGGFDASTGDLDSPLTTNLYTDTALAVGDLYVVSTAGNFFGNAATPLTPGDSVIVQTAVPDPGTTPAVEGDFIVVQSDTDLATLTTVGIGNVNASTLDAELGIKVAYAAGTAKVGLDIIGLPTYSGSGGTPDTASLFIPLHNADTSDSNEIITIEQLAPIISGGLSKTGTITAGNLSGTVIHDFGINTIVQTISSSGDTVFCDVTRTATTSVATIAVAEATDITILVQKIG